MIPKDRTAVKTDGISYDTAAFNRWNDERNVNVNRNDNDWNDDWFLAGLRNSHYFSPAFAGEFCFWSCPCQPPNILPISLSGDESAMYFLVSSDPFSHATMQSILRVSSFRMANRTKGRFSSRERKLAAAIASMHSTKR